MPLTSGKSALQSAFYGMYTDINGPKSAAEFAKRKAQAMYDFVHTAKPMTIITTFPGGVVGAQTAGPVQGMGLGGLDKPAPGMGLDAAHSILKSELEAIYTHGNNAGTAAEFARKEAQAIFNYFSQAIVMTQDKTDGPMPAPPPAGPVTGSIKGKGGIAGSPSPGSGYDAAKPILEAELRRIFEKIFSAGTVSQYASEIAAAYHNFCKEAKIDTEGTFVAPAAVAPPPAPPNGAYFPGVGASTKGEIS